MESGRATLPALLSNCPCSTGLTVPALLSNCPCASVPELVRVRLRMRFVHIWPFLFPRAVGLMMFLDRVWVDFDLLLPHLFRDPADAPCVARRPHVRKQVW